MCQCRFVEAPTGGSPLTGLAHRRPGGARARARVRIAAVRSPGAIGARRAAAACSSTAAERRASTLHLEVDSRGRCSAVAGRHGLVIRHELASVAASGRIGCCCPGQPCAACAHPLQLAWRRTQQAADTAARRALRGRAGDGPSQRAIRRTPGHPMPRTTAMRRAASIGKHLSVNGSTTCPTDATLAGGVCHRRAKHGGFAGRAEQ